MAKTNKQSKNYVKIRKGHNSLVENSLEIIQVLHSQDKDLRIIIRCIFNYLKINMITINRCRILWQEKYKYLGKQISKTEDYNN